MIRRYIAFAAVVAIGLAVLVVWGLGRGSNGAARGSAAEIESAALTQLGPNTIFHTIDLVYRRHGRGDAEPPKNDDFRPEWTEIETWVTFDSTGSLADARSETRGLDGTVYAHSEVIDGVLLMYDARGDEQRRIEGFGDNTTASALRTELSNAADAAATAVAAPGVQSESLNGFAVWVVEQRRSLADTSERGTSGGLGGDASVTGYRIPHIADLDPVEEIRRYYILQDENRGVKSEVVMVSRDGTETVVESREHLILEVLQQQ